MRGDYNIANKLKILRETKETIECIIKLKEKLPHLRNKNYQINQIMLKNDKFVCIIKNASELVEGISFELYVEDNGIEELAGVIENYHVQPNGTAQLNILNININWDFLSKVKRSCIEEGKYIPKGHRLELIIPPEIKAFKIQDLRNFSKQL